MNTKPLTGSHFLVEWNGMPLANITEVEGLNIEMDIINYRSGNDKEANQKTTTGLHTFGTLTMRRILTAGDLFFFQQAKEAMNGNAEKANLTIRLLNKKQEPVITYLVRQALTVGYDGPSLNAEFNDVLTETISLTYEGLDLESL